MVSKFQNFRVLAPFHPISYRFISKSKIIQKNNNMLPELFVSHEAFALCNYKEKK